MKTRIILALLFLPIVSPVLGDAATPGPTATPVLFQLPVIDGESPVVSGKVAVDYSGPDTPQAFSLIDLSVAKKLGTDGVAARGTIRVEKPVSGSDGSETVDLRDAEISLSESWFEARLGRMDLSDLVTTTHFFGLYPLMGQRRLDGVKVYIPFRFFFGVGDDNGLSSPPTSLSFFYFPTLFAAPGASIDGSQGFFMGQARMKFNLGSLTTILLFNLGASSSNLLQYGSLSGKPTYSICGEADFSRNCSLYFEYGVQNTAQAGTNAFCFGARARHLFTWNFLSLDEAIFEVQVPLGQDPNNPFTGGNGVDPSLAGIPQNAWYGKARIKINSVFIDINVTDSQNDFTLTRLNASNINTPYPLPMGRGNETDGLEIPLSSQGYGNIAFGVDMGVGF